MPDSCMNTSFNSTTLENNIIEDVFAVVGIWSPCCFFLQLFIVVWLLKAVGPEVDVCLHSWSKGTWKCHSKDPGSSECVYKIVHLWEEKGGHPLPLQINPREANPALLQASTLDFEG